MNGDEDPDTMESLDEVREMLVTADGSPLSSSLPSDMDDIDGLADADADDPAVTNVFSVPNENESATVF